MLVNGLLPQCLVWNGLVKKKEETTADASSPMPMGPNFQSKEVNQAFILLAFSCV